MTFPEMLERTRAREGIVEGAFSVPAGAARSVSLKVPGQGGMLEGWFSIAGGLGNDIEIEVLATAGGSTQKVWAPGRIKSRGTVRLPLKGGAYQVIFSNRFSTFSSNLISAGIRLTYFR